MTASTEAGFEGLGPELVLRAAEMAGRSPDGRFLQLNSFENRVFSVEADEGPLVLKFYRPGRWSDAAILSEHAFLYELEAAGLPVCAPLRSGSGESLRRLEGLRFAAWDRARGRIPAEFDDSMLAQLGRSLARLQGGGEGGHAADRPPMDAKSLILAPLGFLLKSGLMPRALRGPYEAMARSAAAALESALRGQPSHRIHGDCHWGNLLWDGATLRFLDFDDFCEGPPAQDVWMICPALDAEGSRQRAVLLDAYRGLRPFEPSWLGAVPALRAGRRIRFASWLALRAADPAFPRAFPHFGTDEYWEAELADCENALREAGAPEGPAPTSVVDGEDVSALTDKDYFYDM